MVFSKDRFSDHKDIFDQIKSVIPLPIWWIVGPKIYRMLNELGVETRPRELRRRHNRRMELFKKAGQALYRTEQGF